MSTVMEYREKKEILKKPLAQNHTFCLIISMTNHCEILQLLPVFPLFLPLKCHRQTEFIFLSFLASLSE